MTKAAVFDAYGTLLDVHSAMARHADRLGPGWQGLSAEWRAKQLEYTWVRSLSGAAHHRDFAELTDLALRWVAARHGITDGALIESLSASYRALAAYPEVPAMLAGLRARGIACAILSNGAPSMLAEGVRAAGLAALLDDVLSVEEVGVFKPDPRVYRIAERRFAAPASAMTFVSSNAWDAFGAANAGFRVIWVNRSGAPDEYGLRDHATVVSDLSALPELLA